jgi:hypothetical protein
MHQAIAISRQRILPSAQALDAEPEVGTPGNDRPLALLKLTRLVRGTIAKRTVSADDSRPIVDALRSDT